MPALFVLGGLAAAGLIDVPAAMAVYSSSVADESEDASPRLWLVDGFNVVSVGLLRGERREGWWRSERREALLERAGRFEDPRAEVWVVFDGERADGDRAADRGTPGIVYTPSADDWLVEQVRVNETPSELAIVTADRRLAGRVRHHGARVVSPAEFLRRCQG
ncbi:MAG: NYN domain-containing protein [Planctomycetota bacterium]